MKRNKTMEDPQNLEMVKRRHFSFRINAFFFCIFVLFSILIVKLALLQFVEGKQLSEKEMLNTTRTNAIAPIRGNIFDKDNYPIAWTYSVQSLFYRYGAGGTKQQIVDMAERLEKVFAENGDPDALPLSANEIIRRMDVGFDLSMQDTGKRPSYSFVPRRIKANLSQREIAYMMEHRDEFKGLEIMEESARAYDKENTIAVQLIGYVRPFSTAIGVSNSYLDYYTEHKDEYLQTPTEDVGFDGLEFMYQEELRGKNGEKSYPVNAAQKIVGPATITKPQKGDNLYLTVQKDVQLATEQAIMDQLPKIRVSKNPFEYAPDARSGYAVAMEVKTGNVIAMASMPDYDPNVWTGGSVPAEEYNKIKQFVNNGTITASYPDYPEKDLPKHANSIVYLGSTVKPLTILLGYQEGFITPSTTYYDSGTFYFGRNNSAHISNDNNSAYGSINPRLAIQYSSNVFMSAMVGNPLALKYGVKGLDVWDAFMKQFGLGVLTESGLPNEYAGGLDYYTNVAKGLDSYQSALVRASWGQQARYTTLQLAQYAAMLGNKGKRMKPQFVDKITTYDGELVKQTEPEVLNEVSFPNEDWNSIFQGMIKVHKEGFDGFPYVVAAKTGTSTQSVGGHDVSNAVFIAFAPLENPTLAVAVVVPEGGYGSWGAAPIARKIFQAYDEYIGLDGTPHPAKPANQQ
jgi:penicillin-binding protein 2